MQTGSSFWLHIFHFICILQTIIYTCHVACVRVCVSARPGYGSIIYIVVLLFLSTLCLSCVRGVSMTSSSRSRATKPSGQLFRDVISLRDPDQRVFSVPTAGCRLRTMPGAGTGRRRGMCRHCRVVRVFSGAGCTTRH